MRVLFWSAAFWPRVGGVQRFAVRLLRALRERGYGVVVIAEQDATDLALEDSCDGIPVVLLPLSWRSRQGIDAVAKVRRRLVELLRSFRPQLVHTNAVSDGDFFHHTTAGVSASPWLVTRTLLSADWVTDCSEAIVEQGLWLVPAICQPSSVIPLAEAVSRMLGHLESASQMGIAARARAHTLFVGKGASTRTQPSAKGS